ncbi:hypothetical protein [Siphonobacter sp. SORGH_AS_0500]|uniref:hypothetical protein n=1 Tax=Siphonobacter sp. SORGH_AS_0500 TaxID=1864824 RepID=UPI002860A714|nr:hypothetical protein [Siphonobacter sp. SORGH_AS_0500]MDR6194953.1 hypothetical protein [Siphonobacter sp. SORGH_AS_0500]
MKFIGFITEHDLIEEAKTFQEYLTQGQKEESLMRQLINHLENGAIVLSWLGYSFDVVDNALIAPNAYYTDGTFVWPGYLSYYLSKYPTFNLDKEIINQVLTYERTLQAINSSRLAGIEMKLAKKLTDGCEGY